MYVVTCDHIAYAPSFLHLRASKGVATGVRPKIRLIR
jgi:hypothetical protein